MAIDFTDCKSIEVDVTELTMLDDFVIPVDVVVGNLTVSEDSIIVGN